MKKQFISPGTPVYIINGISGKEYHFYFINLNQIRSIRKLKTVKGNIFFLCLNGIENVLPILKNIGFKQFQSIDIHTNNLFFGADFFLYLINFNPVDALFIQDDIINSNSFFIALPE